MTGDGLRGGGLGIAASELDVLEREALYRAMFERNRAVKLLIDPSSGAIVDANAAAVEYYGYPRDVLHRMKIYEINILSSDAVHDEMERARSANRTTFRFPHRLASGEIRDVEVFSGPVEIRGRTLLHSIVQDVTERNRADRALKESEARYRQIVETAQEGIWLIDAEANTAFVNLRMAEMLGYEPEEMLGRPLLAFMTEEAPADAKEKLAGRREWVSEVHEFRFLRKDGSEIWTRIATNPLPPRDGAYAGALAMVTDITDTRRTEQALRRHEESLHLAQRSAAAGVWTWEMTTGKLDWSPELFRLFGLDPDRDEATFDIWRGVVHPDDRDGAAARIDAAIRRRTGLDSDYRIVRPDGEVRWIRALGSAAYDPAGQPVRMAGICLDITDRKSAEESLRVKDAAIASAMSGIAISNLDGRLTYVNGAFVRMWGYETDDEILGRDRFDYWRDADAVGPVVEAVTTRGRWIGELVAIRKDGSTFQCQVVTNRVDDEHGRPVCTLASFLDVSERKIADEALRASEQRLRSVLENLQDAYFRADANGRYVLMSPSAPRIFGYGSVEEMMAVTARDLYFKPEDRLEILRRIAADGQVDDWVGEAKRKDGTPFWVSMSAYAVRDDERRVVGTQSVVRDITERVRAGEELRTSEAKYRLLAENSLDVIWTMDNEFRTTYVSPAVRRLRGLEPAEALVERAEDSMTEDSFRKVQEAFARRLEEEARGRMDTVSVLELQQRRRNGSLVWVEAVVQPILDGDGLRTGFLGATRDVTERRQAEEEIKSLNADLERRVAARTADLETAVREMEAFSYSVAHDLRAPVRAIDGFTAKLDRGYGGALDDEGRRLLATVRSNTRRMGQLIDDLLSFSRAARAELTKGPVDMEALARGAAAEALSAFPSTQASFRFASLPDASGDASLLREVWHNLVANAVKFSAARPDPVVEIGSRPGPDGTEYFVRDNGVGFDPRFVGKLFGVFERLHAADQFEGTGIGLALVKRIVEKHGGKVWAEGEPDRGATFWFSLPLRR